MQSLPTLRRTLIRQSVIVSAIFITGMLVILIAGLFTVQSSVSKRQEQSIDALILQSEQYLSETEHILHAAIISLTKISRNDQTELLSQVKEHFPRYASLYLLDQNGKVIIQDKTSSSLISLDMSGQPYYLPAKSSEEVYFSKPFVSLTTGLVSVYAAHPIFQDSEFLGMLVGELNLDKLQEFIKQVVVDESTTAFIQDQQGNIIAHPHQEWIQERRNLADLPIVKNIQSYGKVGAIYYDPIQDQAVVGSVKPMNNGWLIATTQPLVIAYQAVIYIFLVSVIIGVVSMAVFLRFQLRNSSKISQPLAKLAQRAENLVRIPQELHVIQEDKTFQEINSLTESFNEMAAEIHDRDRHLEDQIRIRSAEIVEKSQELEIAYVGLKKISQDQILINEINEVLLSGKSLDAVIERFSQKTKVMYSSSGVEGASVFLISKDRKYLVQQNNPVNPDVFEKIEKLVGKQVPMFKIPLKDGTFHKQVMDGKAAKLLNDDENLEKWFEDFINETWISSPWLMKQTKKMTPKIKNMIGINSMAVIPLYAEDEPIGLMEISNKELFSPEDLQRLEMISAQLAVAIKRAQDGGKIVAERNFSDDLINSLPGIIYIFNQQGQFIRWNENLELISGYSSEEILNASPTDFVAVQDQLKTEEAMARVFAEGSASIEAKFKTTHDERPYYFLARRTLIDGEPHLMGSGIDISERINAENTLKKRTMELERSNQDLERFAYIASHDLQEPLRKIQSFGDRLREKYGQQLDEHGETYLTRMLESARRSQEMVEDLLVYSRVSIREKSFESVNLKQIIEAVINDLGTSIELADAVITVDDPPKLAADPAQMFQLFHHLIDNALKFRNPEKRPEIKINLDNKTQDQIQLSIIDNGIGFDPQYIEKIFQPFQRLHGRDVYPGSGIGLAISRRIIERHQGTITVQSKPGEGSVFTITLPLKA